MTCRHCGKRIETSNFDLRYSPKFVHVTANGDRLSPYCELMLAEPTATSPTPTRRRPLGREDVTR